MAEFLETIALDRLPPGKVKVVRIAGKDVALFNVEGKIYAMDDACAHAGVSLGSGKFRGTTVTCRGHGFRYDVTTGHCQSIAGLESPPIRCELSMAKSWCLSTANLAG